MGKPINVSNSFNPGAKAKMLKKVMRISEEKIVSLQRLLDEKDNLIEMLENSLEVYKKEVAGLKEENIKAKAEKDFVKGKLGMLVDICRPWLRSTLKLDNLFGVYQANKYLTDLDKD